MPNQRSPLVGDPGPTSGTPQDHAVSAEHGDTADGTAEDSWPSLGDDLFAGEGAEHVLIACVGWQGRRWYGFSLGYRQAGEAIVDHLRRTGRTTDALFWPFALCWRHYAEVQLKAILELLDQWHRRPVEPMSTHKIGVLWSRTRESLEQGKLGDYGTDLDAVGHVLDQFDRLDPSGGSPGGVGTVNASALLACAHCSPPTPAITGRSPMWNLATCTRLPSKVAQLVTRGRRQLLYSLVE